jgi:hypothetical protein
MSLHSLQGDALYAMELALSLEKLNFLKLRELHAIANKHEDAPMSDFVGMYILQHEDEPMTDFITMYILQHEDEPMPDFITMYIL